MKQKPKSITSKLDPLMLILLLIVLWQGLCMSGAIPPFMLPSPSAVLKAFCAEFQTLLGHSYITLQEAFFGLSISIVLAMLLALVMERCAVIRKAVYPVLVISQTIPMVAIAPLLVLWLGYGLAPKITLVVLTCFFPITIALMNGFQSVEPDQILLLKAMGASEWQILWHVKLPSAIPSFFSGLEISVSYAVVSAVVAEWLGGNAGLGVYMTRVRKAYAFDKMFAVLFWTVFVSLFLIWLLKRIKQKTRPWENKREESNQ